MPTLLFTIRGVLVATTVMKSVRLASCSDRRIGPDPASSSAWGTWRRCEARDEAEAWLLDYLKGKAGPRPEGGLARPGRA